MHQSSIPVQHREFLLHGVTFKNLKLECRSHFLHWPWEFIIYISVNVLEFVRGLRHGTFEDSDASICYEKLVYRLARVVMDELDYTLPFALLVFSLLVVCQLSQFHHSSLIQI